MAIVPTTQLYFSVSVAGMDVDVVGQDGVGYVLAVVVCAGTSPQCRQQRSTCSGGPPQGSCRGHFSMTVPGSWMSTGCPWIFRGGLFPFQSLRPTTVEVCSHPGPPSNHRGGLSPFKASVQPPWRSVPIQGLRPTTVEVCSLIQGLRPPPTVEVCSPGPPSNHHLFPVLIH